MKHAHFVLDCSVTMERTFEDERSAYAKAVFNSFESENAIAYVPRIWSLEIDNVLWMNEKLSRITHQEAVMLRRHLKKLPIVKDSSNEDDFYELAREFKLTTYDASYLELALRKKIPIATFDKELRHAAKHCGIKFYLE